MKPKTKQEHLYVALANSLPPMSEQWRSWAMKTCFSPMAVYKRRRGEVKCLHCGNLSYYSGPDGRAILDSYICVNEYDCPLCGRSMEMTEFYKGFKFEDEKFFTMFTTYRGHQVARTFSARRVNVKGPGEALYEADEVFQIWVDNDGKETITSRPYHRSFYNLTWEYHKPYMIAQHNSSAGGQVIFDDLFDLTGTNLYPVCRVTPRLRRNGWSKLICSYKDMIAITDAARWLLGVPDAEMLAKTGQWDLFVHMIKRGDRTLPYRHAVCIANRRGYRVDDAQMWLDMLDMAGRLGLDTHNPDVVCPADLRAAHDRILARSVRRNRIIRQKEEAMTAAEWEDRYKAEKNRYFGICFGDDEITISVIQSVAEMAEEGLAMHHCVYANEYFKKSDSLILSARDSEGKRLETIEVSLKTFSVVQSRAKFNQTTPQHRRILELVSKNIDKIKQAM